MSRWRNTSDGGVIDVPPQLDATYAFRPEYVPYDPVNPETTPADGPADGPEQPQFDPALPLAAGFTVALDNVAEIKGSALQDSLVTLGLDTTGTADEKRDRLAARLNMEVNGG